MRYLAAATLARTADGGAALLLVLVAVHRGASAGEGALAGSALLLPQLAGGPMLAAAVDRARRPGLAHAAALAVFGAGLTAAVLTVGAAPLGWVLAAAAVAGACGPMASGGMSVRLDAVVPAAMRTRARGWDAASYNIGGLAGPPAAAGLVALGPAASAAAVAVVSAAAAVLAAGLGGETPSARTTQGAVPLRAAARLMLTDRPLRAATAASSLAMLGAGALAPTAVLLGQARGWSSGTGALLMTAFAVGGLAGSLRAARRPPRGTALPLLGCGLALGAAALLPGGAAVAAGGFAVAGFGDGLLLAAVLEVRAVRAPEGARTQVFVLGAGL
ncbi:hypothetical protein BIV57_20200, partial [Mangrovactinospora gilvigrisea]